LEPPSGRPAPQARFPYARVLGLGRCTAVSAVQSFSGARRVCLNAHMARRWPAWLDSRLQRGTVRLPGRCAVVHGGMLGRCTASVSRDRLGPELSAVMSSDERFVGPGCGCAMTCRFLSCLPSMVVRAHASVWRGQVAGEWRADDGHLARLALHLRSPGRRCRCEVLAEDHKIVRLWKVVVQAVVLSQKGQKLGRRLS